jgi:streptogramin lyase
MMQRIQALPQWGRILVFVALVAIVVGFFGGLTAFVLVSTARSTPRTEAIAINDNITLAEFAQLPDADSYPASLALLPDGTLITGSYVSGAMWRITPEGIVSEVPAVRDSIGSITGIDIAPDGNLYVLDRIDPVGASGAILWRITDLETGALEEVLTLPETQNDNTRLPDDVAVDAQGAVYISDRGTDEVLRYADGELTTWWVAPPVQNANFYAPTGLAYHPINDSLIITDSGLSLIYEVPISATNPTEASILRHQHRGAEAPNWDGITVADDGTLYVAALGLNRVAGIAPEAGINDEPAYLAGAFRGSSDVAYDAERERLYIANWDQRALLPVDVLLFQINIDPHLPFALDVITFQSDASQGDTDETSTE